MALSTKDRDLILRTFKRNGVSSGVVGYVRQRYHLTESQVAPLILEATGRSPSRPHNPAPASRRAASIGESSDPFTMRRAELLAEQVNSAEAKGLERASTQELEALAAAYFAR